jgi:hypothetical protein
MHAGANPRRVAAHPNLGGASAKRKRGHHCIARVPEDRHGSVSESLDQGALVARDRVLLGLSDLAQQLQRRIVAGLERPGREADKIGEEDDHVGRPAAATLRLRERLPGLQHPQSELSRRTGALQAKLGDQATEVLGQLVACRGEGVAVPLVPRQQTADQPRSRHQPRPRVGSASDLPELPASATGLAVLRLVVKSVGHRGGCSTDFGARRGKGFAPSVRGKDDGDPAPVDQEVVRWPSKPPPWVSSRPT